MAGRPDSAESVLHLALHHRIDGLQHTASCAQSDFIRFPRSRRIHGVDVSEVDLTAFPDSLYVRRRVHIGDPLQGGWHRLKLDYALKKAFFLESFDDRGQALRAFRV